MMAARRRRAAAGTSFGSVTIACASARPHLHSRAAGIARTALRSTLPAFSALRLRLAMISASVTELCSGMPAIVIGDHGHGGVAELGFARQLGFRDVGHAHDIEAQLPVHVRFGQRGKLRPFDAHVSAAAMGLHARRIASRRPARSRAARRWACRSPRGPRCRRRKTWPRAGRCGRKTGRGS